MDALPSALLDKKKHLLRQNLLYHIFYTIVWGAGQPEASLRLGTEWDSSQLMDHKRDLHSWPVGLQGMHKVSACRKVPEFCATPPSCRGWHGAGWMSNQNHSKLLCKGGWKENVCSVEMRCLRAGFDTARDSKKGRNKWEDTGTQTCLTNGKGGDGVNQTWSATLLGWRHWKV